MITKTAIVNYDHLWNTIYGDVQRYGPTHRHTVRLCTDILKKLQYSSVLDVGCGPGCNYSLLTEGRKVSFAGLDISQQAIRKATDTYPTDRFEVLDIASECLEERFDLVFSGYLLEHVSDDRAALENMLHMCSRYFLLVTVQGNFKRYEKTERLFGHLRNYRRGELQIAIRERGFDILKSVEWGFPFYSPISRFLTSCAPLKVAGHYGWIERLLASFLHKLYYLNAKWLGDILILLAERRS